MAENWKEKRLYEQARKFRPSRPMMATAAFHLLGDISNETPELCNVSAEDDENWYGSWATGLGFFGVRFPKATTRELSDAERAHYEKVHLVLGDVDIGPAVKPRNH